MQYNHNFQNWKKSIILFLSGQAVSLFGSAVVEFAIIWHITLTTKSGTMMTISMICVFVPRLLISPFSGVWADRYNRKLLIIWADAGIAFTTILLAIIYISGYQELWLLFVAMAIRSVGTGIQTPAVGAILPQIVPTDKLLKVNGLNSSLQSIITLLAPAVSGALLAAIPLGMIFFVDVATASIAVIITSLLAVKSHVKDRNSINVGYYEDLKMGIEYARKNIFVRSMLIIYAVFYFCITPAAFLATLYIARTFGDEVWRLTVYEIGFSTGALLGGLIIARWGGFRNGIDTIASACLGLGITSIIVGFSGFIVFISAISVMGIFTSLFSSVEMTLIQKQVESNMQGRVFGLIQIVSTLMMPVGMLLFGPLGDIVEVGWLIIGGGILSALLGIRVFLNKNLKRLIM